MTKEQDSLGEAGEIFRVHLQHVFSPEDIDAEKLANFAYIASQTLKFEGVEKMREKMRALIKDAASVDLITVDDAECALEYIENHVSRYHFGVDLG